MCSLRLINFPNFAHLTTSSVFRHSFVNQLGQQKMGSVVHDLQAKPLKTSPAEFPTLCLGKKNNNKDLGKVETKRERTWVPEGPHGNQHRRWYKGEINFYCDNWYFKVYVSPISMSLINMPAVYHCFANEVTGSKVNNLLIIIQRQVKELEDTQNSALIHSINCLTPSYWAKSYSAQSLLFKTFSSSTGELPPPPEFQQSLLFIFNLFIFN